jgi:3-(3-hydroxy-phenyl)propionate hydroxylase
VTLSHPVIDEDLAEWFAGVGGMVAPIDCGPGSMVDVEDAYRKWFADHGVVAVLQRPDFAVYGTATRESEIPDLLRSLRAALKSARNRFSELA